MKDPDLDQRVARVRQHSFLDGLRACLPGLDVPDRGGMIVCPVPSHPDGTPSCSVHPDKGWFCHGCKAGGDLISLVQAVQGLPWIEALRAVERALGFEQGPQGLIDQARRPDLPAEARARERDKTWRASLASLEARFHQAMRLYVRQVGLEAFGRRAQQVWDACQDEIREVALEGPSLTDRRSRERLDRLRGRLRASLDWLALEAKWVHGLDRAALYANLAPDLARPEPLDDPDVFVGCMVLLAALNERERLMARQDRQDQP